MSAPRVRELTARARGGVAVVSVSGPGSLERVSAACPGVHLAPGRICLARLEDPAGPLDEALIVVLAPDEVELHLHGSPPLVRRVLELMGGTADTPGASLSLEQRAFVLSATAPCEGAARLLLDQAGGALRHELEALLAAGAVEQDERMVTLLRRARLARFALQPALVLLVGPANAGKSTLFNALLGERRALVSAEAGTTRDVVIERARLGAWPVDLADAPGPRGAEETAASAAVLALEEQGRQLARRLAERTDLVLQLAPAPLPLPWPAPAQAGPTLVLTSRADLFGPDERRARAPAISALDDPSGAAALVARLFRERLGLPRDPWTPGAAVPFEASQVAALEAALGCGGAERGRVLGTLLES